MQGNEKRLAASIRFLLGEDALRLHHGGDRAHKHEARPQKTGAFLPATQWKISVPSPAVKIAAAGLSPVEIGTMTVAPNMEKRCWNAKSTFLAFIPGKNFGFIRSAHFLIPNTFFAIILQRSLRFSQNFTGGEFAGRTARPKQRETQAAVPCPKMRRVQ